jgi:hypothetical protein
VASYGTPACLPTLKMLQADPTYLQRMANTTLLGESPSVDMVQQGSDLQVSPCLLFHTPQ